MNLRKINRGIALGCVIAVATVGYIVYDNVQFSKNKEDITSAVEDYLNQLADARCSIKDQQELSEAYKKIINERWVNGSTLINELSYIPTKAEILAEFKNAIEDYEPTGYFTDYNLNITDISIKKYGTNGAIANLEYEVACEFYGTPLEMDSWGLTTADNENYDNYGTCNTDPSILYHQNRTYESEDYYLKLIDGEWKIYAVSGYYYMSDTKQIDEVEGGAENE